VHLRRANRQIVDAIKAMKEMQDNIDRFMCADNEYIRREYNSIRLNLAILLRALFTIRTEVGPAQKMQQLGELKLRMEEEDTIANGVLDKLIREDLITPDMATSLMNDSSYSYDIQRNIFEAADIIFANVYSLDKDLSLTEEEVDAQLRARREDFLSRLREEEERIDEIASSGRDHAGSDAPPPGT
jgi:phosphate:Na+ symporter